MSVFLKRNDIGDVISFTCENEDGSFVDLSGATVKFNMGKKNKLITSGAATVKDAQNGVVEYILTDADTLVAGNFPSEFEVTFSNGNVKTFPRIGYLQVNIEPNLDLGRTSVAEDRIALRVSEITIFKDEMTVIMNQAKADADKVNNFDARINNIVAQSGQSSTEMVDSRQSTPQGNKTFTTLRTRLDYMETSSMQRGINVMDAPYNAKGDGVTDDTAAINSAINSLGSNGGVILFPYGKTFMINGLGGVTDYPTGGVKLKSNITLLMHGAKLKVIPNNSENYACLNITDCDNVYIYGGTVQGERDNHTPSPNYGTMGDQWGYGIAIVGSRNVHIEGVIARDCGGDGIYIGHRSGAGTESKDVRVVNCVVDRNARNGISITGLVGGLIDGTTCKNTIGVSPECGLDIEPNPSRIVESVTIVNSKFNNNKQHGLLFASIELDTRSGKYCIVKGNEFRKNELSGLYTNRADCNTISDNISIENKNNGFVFLQSLHNDIINNKAIKNYFHGFMIGDNSDHNEISNNSSRGNSQAGNNSYDQFNIWTSMRNNIQHNTGRHMGLAIKARYGMYIDTTSTGNLAMHNDMFESCISGGFNNTSATTGKGAGNRGNTAAFNTNDFV